MLDYGIVGNCKTCALIKKNGSVEWMCYPTFSSPSIFAKILDKKIGGSLEIKTKGRYKITQKYVENTAVLETTFASDKAEFKVIDFFPRYRKLNKKNYSMLVRQNKLYRIIRPIRGKPVIKIQYNPKPNYAKDECSFSNKEGTILCKSDQGIVACYTNIDNINKEFTLKSTKYLVIGAQDDEAFTVRRCLSTLSATKKYWQRWVGTLVVPEQNREIIIRSAITLKLLTYSLTGAIVAAATTSIPEEVGSERTWDYRFCWVRDSLLHVDALKKLGRSYETKKLMKFLMDLVLKDKNIQIMYGLKGETNLKEKFLHHLSGFKNSKPVRVGNAAFDQIQHDIYGEMIDIMYLYFCYYQYEKKLTKKHWRFVCYLVRQIKKNWRKKDSGIWEFRGMREHYVYSKFMCWVGVDRAIKIARCQNNTGKVKQWLKLRERIFKEIMRKGYNKKVNSFTMFYGSDKLDASLLHMAYHEFLPPDDPRLINTVKKIYQNLRTGDLVQRYKIKDDFGKSTSAFSICSFWLIEALYYIGEKEKAQKIFKKITKRGNHLGLFSEDIDIKTKKLIGNFPQAYTHLAIINTSILLSEWNTKRKKIDWKYSSSIF